MGTEGERRIVRQARRAGVSSRRVPRSQGRGATYGDVIIGDWLVEEKSTPRIPFLRWWPKVTYEAWRVGRRPALVLHGEGPALVVLRWDDFLRLVRLVGGV